MPTAFEALRPEMDRLLLIRDLSSAARHALEIEPNADAVSLTVTFNREGFALDVAYFRGHIAISGWGH